ncbi:serine hydrolase-domain-containing protein [Aspergillus crustosus]
MESNKAAPQDKFRVLLIHGFAGTGSHIIAKTAPITKRLAELITPDILSEFPGGIEFLTPDAPMLLEPPFGLTRNTDDSIGDENDDLEKPNTLPGQRHEQTALGWWYGRDTLNHYKGIEASLSFLARYIHGRPIHGIIGFSQGGAMAGMVCSLVDCHYNPEKVAAIRAQGLPADDYLQLPGQERLRFMVAIGGYQGTLKYYGSLYQWPMHTPSIHTLASMDAIVEHQHSMALARCFTSYEIVEYFGAHFVPRDDVSVNALAYFAANASLRGGLHQCLRLPATPPLSQSGSISEDEDFSTTASSSTGRSRSDGSGSRRLITVWKRKRQTRVAWGRRVQAVASPT